MTELRDVQSHAGRPANRHRQHFRPQPRTVAGATRHPLIQVCGGPAFIIDLAAGLCYFPGSYEVRPAPRFRFTLFPQSLKELQ